MSQKTVKRTFLADAILQHDNALPHTSRQTQDALAQLKLPALPHPAYSPDLALSDYFIVPPAQEASEGKSLR